MGTATECKTDGVCFKIGTGFFPTVFSAGSLKISVHRREFQIAVKRQTASDDSAELEAEIGTESLESAFSGVSVIAHNQFAVPFIEMVGICLVCRPRVTRAQIGFEEESVMDVVFFWSFFRRGRTSLLHRLGNRPLSVNRMRLDILCRRIHLRRRSILRQHHRLLGLL